MFDKKDQNRNQYKNGLQNAAPLICCTGILMGIRPVLEKPHPHLWPPREYWSTSSSVAAPHVVFNRVSLNACVFFTRSLWGLPMKHVIPTSKSRDNRVEPRPRGSLLGRKRIRVCPSPLEFHREPWTLFVEIIH